MTNWETYREAYKVLQKTWDIEVGDNVKVLRTFRTNEFGCNACWKDHKGLIGQSFKVTYVGENSVALDIPTSSADSAYNLFPFFVLEKVGPAIEITLKVNGETRKLKDISEETLLRIRKGENDV